MDNIDNASATASDTTPAEPTSTPAPAPEGEKVKRTHTSPRLLALTEVDAEIATLRTKWEAASGDPSRDDVLSVLAKLSESVGVLKGGHPKVGAGGEKSSSPRPANPYAGKRHYVGKLAGEEYIYIDSEGKAPTPGNFPMCSHIWGPCRTEDGARYKAAHVGEGALAGLNQVF